MPSILKILANSPKNTIYDNLRGIQLDVSFITPRIIVSGAPTTSIVNSFVYTKLEDILRYVNDSHSNNWWVFNLQGEGCDYTDVQLNYQVSHYPFPDHEPPPIKLMLQCIQSISQFLNKSDKNIALIHCKNGKGRSGTIVCAYLMVYEGYSLKVANDLFTQKRMKHFSGNGVSIISQLRYLGYLRQMIDNPRIKQNYIHAPSIKLEFLKIELINWKPYKKNLDVYTYIYINHGCELVKLYTWENTKTNDEIGFFRNLQYKMDYTKMPTFSNKQDMNLAIGTFASATFNIFFESLYSNRLTLSWDDFDGINGTSLKGRQLFDQLHISWQVEGAHML